jgi:hypothetical protein
MTKRSYRPSGGITVVVGGDFCRILPVIQKGRRHNIVTAPVKYRIFGKYFHIHTEANKEHAN